MFHLRKLLDPNSPRRRVGLLVGAGVVVAAMSLYNPVGDLMAADGDGKADAEEMEMAAECNSTETLGILAKDLRTRKTEMEKKRLAVERESAALDESRGDLKAQLEEIAAQRKAFEDRMVSWEQKRTDERKERLDKLVGIVGEMKADGAAKMLEKTKPDLAVDVLLRLDQKRAAEILAMIGPAHAASLTGAMSDSSR
jgi:flagellar motility protein MotE (MotC chaperone)